VRRSPLTLAALATAAIPGLDVVATRSPQHDGSDFAVTGVLDSGGRRWIVRCPQHAAAGAALEGEVALLERLAEAVDDGLLPFDVPRPAGFAALPEGGRAMVYRELLGRPVDVAALRPGPHLAARVGRALAAIHELPAAVVESAGLPVYDAEGSRVRRLAELDEAAATGYIPSTLLRRWEHALEDVALWRFRSTPVHGDLAADHVLVANDDVQGIVDWSDARVGDPADDLAWLVASAPEAGLEAVLEAYSLARTERGDDHLVERATLASELALARWLLYGVRTGDREIVAEAAQMLAELADAAGDEQPGDAATATAPAGATTATAPAGATTATAPAGATTATAPAGAATAAAEGSEVPPAGAATAAAEGSEVPPASAEPLTETAEMPAEGSGRGPATSARDSDVTQEIPVDRRPR
jgi:aminoglycoside phosphotransferase (APT) family kinase protein